MFESSQRDKVDGSVCGEAGRGPTGSGWRRIIADRFKLKAVSALFPVSDCRVWSISYADCGAINNIPL